MSTNASAPSSQAQTTTSAQESSAPTQSTSGSPTTTTTTAASPTTTTTPQSSSAQTSSSGVATTSPTSTSPTSSTSTAASPTTTSSFTSQVATTLYSTNSVGSVVYFTTTVPDVIATSVGSHSGSSSHTGVIVGAVIGGVSGIVMLVLLLFCIRRRVRKDEFDGNFDPDRVIGHTDGDGGTLPRVDLADEVTPFPQSYADEGSMRQYSESPYFPVPSSPATGGQSKAERYASGAGAPLDARRSFMQSGAGSASPGTYIPPMDVYDAGSVDWHGPLSGVSPPLSTASQSTSSNRAAKEREASGRGRQNLELGLATQPEVAEGSVDVVVVHQDAGRAPAEEHAPPREIPPAYESIPQD